MDANERGIGRLRQRIDDWRGGLSPEDAARLRCVLLFGSRARGDHRPNSDWDLLAVWDGAPPRGACGISGHEGLPADWLNRDEASFVADAARTGTLPRLALKRGVVLCGARPCEPPETGEAMNQEDWIDRFDAFCMEAERVAAAVVDAVGNMGIPHRSLIKGSADFAELVAKFALVLKGIDPDKTHKIDELAKQWPSGDGYAERIKALDGDTRQDHVAGYARLLLEFGPADNDRAIRRAADAMRLLRDVLEDSGLGGAGFSPAPLTEEQWDMACATAASSVDKWRVRVVGYLASAQAAGEEEPLVERMCADAERVGAWAALMYEEIMRSRHAAEKDPEPGFP